MNLRRLHPREWLPRLRERLFEPVDIASIAVFRMMYGAVLFWEVWRFFENGWIRSYYISPDFHFKYYGFEWVHPWPGDWMYVHFVVVGILALCVMTGLLYRVTSVLFFLGFTYWFLLDETRYLNHLYLTALLAFLLAVIPAHRARSFDAWLRPRIRSSTIPAWYLWLLRFQVGIVYFYAGVAKINWDWLQGEPIRRWLARRSDYPLIGSWLETESAVVFFGYGGLLFDLLVVPFLIWRKSRPWAFASVVLFHTLNNWLFGIGIFPVLMLAATLLFFEPDWPRRLVFFFAPRGADGSTPPAAPATGRVQTLTLAFLGVWAAVQVFMPLRHFLYPGSVHWTEEGHRFAWHMKLREKRATATFIARDPTTGRTWRINPRRYLTSRQSDRVGRWPDMCLQFAHFLARELGRDGQADIEVRVECKASLNGRPYQRFIDPTVDLAKERRSLAHAEWIIPLTTPLGE